MTKNRNLKRRVRERQARTGESYVTARRHVVAAAPEPARSTVPVIELIDLSDRARQIGLRCWIMMWPSLAERIDPPAVLARLRDALVASADDPEARPIVQLAIAGQPPRPARKVSIDRDELRRLLRKACAGLGGFSKDGRMLAFGVGDVPVLCTLSRDGLALQAVDDPELQLEPEPEVERSPEVEQSPIGAGALYVIYEGRRLRVRDGWLVGRTRTCDLQLKDGIISRRHAIVKRHGTAYYIKDLESVNGVYYKGTPISNKRIEEGDVFHLGAGLGDYALRFTFRDAD
jgi:hypothetical protein